MVLQEIDSIEALIAVLSQITDLITKTDVDYGKVMDLIEIEHECIRKGDFEGVEKNLKLKAKTSQDIVKKVEDLIQKSRNLVKCIAADDSFFLEQNITLLQLRSLLEKHIEKHDDLLLKNRILKNVVQKFGVAIDKLLERRASVIPKIEMNSYILGKLMQRHERLRAVFQKGISESNSTYTSKGVTSSQEPLPMLQVRT
jgi:hypothetical protein